MQMLKFIKTELKSDSELDLDSDLEKMEAKVDKELEADSDNDSVYDIVLWFFYLHKWLLIFIVYYWFY